MQLVTRIQTGKLPYWLSFSPDGKYAVVSNADSDDVLVIDTATYKEVARVKVGKAPKRLVVGNVPTP